MINWRTQSTGNSDLELAPQSFTTRPIFVAVSAHPSMCTSVCVWGRGRMADWHPRTKILKPEGSHATNTSSTRSAAPWLTDFFARSPMALAIWSSKLCSTLSLAWTAGRGVFGGYGQFCLDLLMRCDVGLWFHAILQQWH